MRLAPHAGRGAPTTSDSVTILSGSADGQYRGRHNWIGFGYTGALSLYRTLDTLNSFDQQARLETRHVLSPRLTLKLRDSLALVPTTDAIPLSGIPFVRTGSRLENASADLSLAVSARTVVSGEAAASEMPSQIAALAAPAGDPRSRTPNSAALRSDALMGGTPRRRPGCRRLRV